MWNLFANLLENQNGKYFGVFDIILDIENKYVILHEKSRMTYLFCTITLLDGMV